MSKRSKNLVSTTQRVLKQSAVILCMLLVGLFFATSCEKLKELRESLVIPDPPDPPVPVGSLQYVRTEFGGCNLGPGMGSVDSELASRSGKSQKASNITISEDSVNVFVDLNYICKARPFETRVDFIDGVMYMYIIDTQEGGYFRCSCYYTFDFVFKHNEEINQMYKIVLMGIQGGDHSTIHTTIVSEGIITNSANP